MNEYKNKLIQFLMEINFTKENDNIIINEKDFDFLIQHYPKERLKHYLEIYKYSLNVHDLKFFKVYQFDNKIRLGSNADGGYVIGELNNDYDCYISCGVSDEESFSRDFINRYNIDKSNSYAFDGTIQDYPYQYTNNITFIKKNINNYNDEYNTDLIDIIDKYDNIFLKMDIEGSEFTWLLNLPEEKLVKFKQMVFEFHGIYNNTWNNKYSDKIKCFEKLSKTHYLIHAHGNNSAPVENNIPEVVEFTYINKNAVDSKLELNVTPLPIIDLDYTNFGNETINLNFYPFVNNL